MIRTIDFYGLRAVEFQKGDYTALVVPEVGANMIRLANTRLGIEIVRTPKADEIEEFKKRPQIFGQPLLFPPNRIEDGHFTFEGHTYQFPITDEKGHHFHHGFIKGEPFQVSKAIETDETVMIECRYYSNAGNDAIYKDYPHEFKCKITYTLSNQGMRQEVMFANRSKTRMPIGVGFHTPMAIPFAEGKGADYVMRVAIKEQIELNGRLLPTGRKLPLTEQFKKLRNEGLQVTDCDPIEAAFTIEEIEVDGKPFRGAMVENRKTGHRTFYEVDDQAVCWTIWNHLGDKPYCCPEPQTWITNAPNAPDPVAAGLKSIAPGDKWRMTCKFYAK